MKMTKVGCVLMGLALAGAARGDYYWTGASSTNPTDWYDTANWYNNTMSGGNCVIGGSQKSSLTGRTIAFTNAVTAAVKDGLWVENGSTNRDDAVVWTTGDTADDDAGLTVKGTLNVGTGTWGALKAEKGKYSFSGNGVIGNSSGCSYMKVTDSHFSFGAQFDLAIKSAKTVFEMTGGTVDVAGDGWWACDGSARTVADISGGTMTFTNALNLGNNNGSGSSEITIRDAGRLDVLSTGDAFSIRKGSNVVNVINGGTLSVYGFRYWNSPSPAELNLEGGRIVVLDGGRDPFIDPDDNFKVTVRGDTASVLDANGKTVNLSTVKIGGEGTLTLTNGTFKFGAGITLPAMVFASDATIQVDPSTQTNDAPYVYASWTSGELSADKFTVLNPSGCKVTLDNVNHQIVVDPRDYWIGGETTTAANWDTASNWSNGVTPVNGAVAVFTNSAAVYRNSGSYVNGILLDGADVVLTVSQGTGDDYWTDFVKGTGKLVLGTHVCLCAKAGHDLVIDVPVEITSESSDPCWFCGGTDYKYGTVHMNGKLTGDASACLRAYGYGAGGVYFSGDMSGYHGTIEISSWNSNDSYLMGDALSASTVTWKIDGRLHILGVNGVTASLGAVSGNGTIYLEPTGTLPAEPYDCLTWTSGTIAESDLVLPTALPNYMFTLDNTNCKVTFNPRDYWVGGEGVAEWSTASNWSGNETPNAYAVAYFTNSVAMTGTAGKSARSIVIDGEEVVLTLTNLTADCWTKSVTGTGRLVLGNEGIFTLKTAPSCPVEVATGVLSLKAGTEFASTLTVGATAAIAVDITGAVTASTTEGAKINLFKASTLKFAAEDDTVDTSVFLIGPVVGYTLSTNDDGWVQATVTDVTNISSTRKVTTFIAGDAEDSCVADNHHVHQSAAFSNGTPSGSYDVVVVPGAAMMCIKSGNLMQYGDLVIRGGTLKVRTSSAHPILDVRHVAGNGTLSLRHVGLESASGVNLTVDSTVAVEFSCAGLDDAKTDTWTKGYNATTTVNGPVIVTNGVLCVYIGTVFNGPVTIGPYAAKTSWLDANTTINGTWTILDGADFNFNSKTVTMGENAKLVLEGTGKISNVSGATFPKIVLGEGYAGIYGAMNAVSAGEYIVDGGTMKMTPTAAVGTGTNVVLRSGTLVVDISGETASSIGTSYTLSNVALADGASLSDLTFKFSGQNFGCTATMDETTGTITVTTTAPADGDNHWVGGVYGTFETSANWTLGTPTKDQRIVFDNAATVSFTTKPDIGTLVFNADVTFNRGTGGEKFHIQGSEGTGTLTLDYMGIANIKGQSASISNNLNMINGAWFGDYDYTGELSVYGNVSGSGGVNIWGKENNLNFYGDNSGFTGHVTVDQQNRPVHFRSAKSGFSHAEYFDQSHGNLNISIPEGTITFSGLKIHSNIAMLDSATSGAGVTLVIGNDNRDCTFDGSGSAGCDKLTIKKIGTGTFSNSLQSAYNLDLEGGTTTFTVDNVSAIIGVTNATIKAAENRTLGTVTFGSGSCLAANLAWDTTAGDDGSVTTNGLKTATLTVTGSTDLGNLIVTLGNTGLTNQVDSAWTAMPTLLSVTGSDSTLTGTPTLGCTDISNLVAKVANNKLTLAYGTSFSPDETSATTYATAIAATNAANAATVQLSSARIELGQLADYFTNVVTKVSDSSYTVTTRLNEEKVMPTSSAMTSATNGGVTVTPSNVKKGLYYRLVAKGASESAYSADSNHGYTLATDGNIGSLALTNDSTGGNGDKVIYYKVEVSDTAQ